MNTKDKTTANVNAHSKHVERAFRRMAKNDTNTKVWVPKPFFESVTPAEPSKLKKE